MPRLARFALVLIPILALRYFFGPESVEFLFGDSDFFEAVLVWTFILITLVYGVRWLLVSMKSNKKSRECQELQEKLKDDDPSWGEWAIKPRVKEAFFAILQGWSSQNLNNAKEYMSPRFFENEQENVERLLERGQRNKLMDIRLIETLIVEIADCKDDGRDSFWAVMNGSMIDFIEDSKTHQVISGDPIRAREFKDLWLFIRNGNGEWVLDEIRNEVTVSDLDELRSYSEELG